MRANETNALFHDGERRMQERSGVRERIDQIAPAIIRAEMPLQHRHFFAMQQLVFVGSVDDARRPWASVLWGERGFVHAPDAGHLRIDAIPQPGDPLAANLADGAPLGLLGIELATRRRNRLNGTVTDLDENGFVLTVDQSFGNCPQYIQARDAQLLESRGEPAMSHHLGATLSERAMQLIRRADTLMIASAAAGARGHAGADGVDISHRGGKPGFVRTTLSPRGRVLLTMPDFRGNFLFNTLGNLLSHPWAGLLFIDFDSGDLLQVTGEAAVIEGGPDVESFAGAQRLVTIEVAEGRLHPSALPFRWSPPEQARQLDDTGDWRRI